MIYSNVKLIPEKLQLSFGELLACRLGEHGRGRKEIILPVKFDAVVGEPLDLRGLSIGQSIAGNPTLIKRTDNELFLILSSYGGYTRRGNGRIIPIEGDFKVLAEGWGADGDAGRIGDWDVKIIKAPNKGVIRISYSGKYRYGVDPEYNELLFIDGGHVDTVMLSQMEAYCDAKGIALPPFVKYNSDGEFEFVQV